MGISQQIEALLFFKGEPVSKDFLAKTLGVSVEDIETGIVQLESELSTRGIILVQNNGEYTLGTAKEMGSTIEAILKEELAKDLGKAGLETLAIVLYRGPVLRSEINYIRGVNSNHILRNLLIRGLIEKVDQEGRSTAYQPTFELLSYMGVGKVSDLPEYAKMEEAILEFQEQSNTENDNEV